MSLSSFRRVNKKKTLILRTKRRNLVTTERRIRLNWYGYKYAICTRMVFSGIKYIFIGFVFDI